VHSFKDTNERGSEQLLSNGKTGGTKHTNSIKDGEYRVHRFPTCNLRGYNLQDLRLSSEGRNLHLSQVTEFSGVQAGRRAMDYIHREVELRLLICRLLQRAFLWDCNPRHKRFVRVDHLSFYSDRPKVPIVTKVHFNIMAVTVQFPLCDLTREKFSSCIGEWDFSSYIRPGYSYFILHWFQELFIIQQEFVSTLCQ